MGPQYKFNLVQLFSQISLIKKLKFIRANLCNLKDTNEGAMQAMLCYVQTQLSIGCSARMSINCFIDCN